MAEKQLDSLSQVKAKSLNCAICLDRFKDPRILKQCLHSFCCGCLVKLAEGTPTIKCPLCQEEIPVPERGAQYFPSNFQLGEIVEEAVMHDSLLQNARVMCDCHEEEVEAVSRCFECNEYLCANGVDSHRRFRQLESHPVASLEDLRSGKVRPRGLAVPKRICCKKHPQDEAKYFCEFCDVPICHTCYNLSHNDKKRHACKDIRDSIPILRKRVADVAKSLDTLARESERVKERNDQIAQNIQEQAVHKKAVIATRIEEAKQRLEDVKRQQHEQVDLVMRREAQPYQQLSANLGRTAMQARNAHAQAAGLKDANDGEFMQMYDIMREKMTQLASLRRPEERRQPGEIDWPEWVEEQNKCTIL